MPFTAPSRASSTAEAGSSTTPTTPVSPAEAGTRRERTARRRRTRRLRTLAIGCVAATALVGGTGFVVAGATGMPNAFGIATGTSSTSAGASGLPAGVEVVTSSDGRISVYTAGIVTRADADSEAKAALATGHLVAQNAKGKADASSLTSSIAKLADYRSMSPDTVMERVSATQNAAEQVGAQTLVATDRIAAQKQAAETKAQAEAQAKADAARQAAANTPAGAKATAQQLMESQYGWGSDQFSCLASLWSKESGWNYKAYNPSGATGIPQALPGSKMGTVASDWSTNATTQIIWGLAYIKGSYGTPCAAWAHSQANNWY